MLRGIKGEIFDKHYEEECEIDCINGCGKKLTRKTFNDHQIICEKVKTVCSASDVGCKYTALKEEMRDHENGCVFVTLAETLRRQQNAINMLRSVCQIKKDMRNGNFEGWDFSGMDIIDVDFRGSNLTNANFTNANLTGSNFRDAKLDGVIFKGSSLAGANFTNSNLSKKDFRGCDMRYCVLTSANLTDANLSGVNLSRSVLYNVSLSSFDFKNCFLPGSLWIKFLASDWDILYYCKDRVRVCGVNENGRLHVMLGHKEAVAIPTKLPIDLNILFLHYYHESTLFLLCDDGVYASGDNTDGELGLGPKGGIVTKPTKVFFPSKVLAIKEGKFNGRVFFVCEDGVYQIRALEFKSDNYYGDCVKCNKNRVETRNSVCKECYAIDPPYLPTRILASLNVYSVSENFILCEEGVFAMGDNRNGELGLGHREKVKNPTKVPINSRVIAVECGGSSTFFLCSDGTVYACGDNGKGKLGIGSSDDSVSTPRKVLLESEAVTVTGGCECPDLFLFHCKDGVFICGNGKYFGLPKELLVPRKISFEADVLDIKCSYNYFFICKDGVYGCGDNSYGSLGLGHEEEVLFPTKIPLKTKLIAFESMCYTTYFVCEDGIYGCGTAEALGLGDPYVKVFTPTKLPIQPRFF